MLTHSHKVGVGWTTTGLLMQQLKTYFEKSKENADIFSPSNTTRKPLSRLAPIEPSKPSATPSEYSENSEYSEKSPSKSSSRKATVAKAMGKIFGLDIDIIDNDANLTGDQARAKGWYDTETGKITAALDVCNLDKTVLVERVNGCSIELAQGIEAQSVLSHKNPFLPFCQLDTLQSVNIVK